MASGLFSLGENAIVQAQGAAPGRERVKQSATYRPGDIHLEKSRVYVHVGKTGLGHEHGVVGQMKAGSIHLAGAEPDDQIVFDMTTFEADTDAARKYVGLSGSTDASTRTQVNENMTGEKILNVKKYPTATLEIKSIKKMAQDSKRGLPQYQIAGDFTLHGTKHPIAVVADAEINGDWVHLRGSFAILQSKYGITPFTKGYGLIGVADRLEIWGDFWVANGR